MGLGHEEDCCSPQEVTSLNTDEIYIVNVCSSGAATILLSDSGSLYACGENNENRYGVQFFNDPINFEMHFLTFCRLGLDIPGLFGLTTTTVEWALSPTKVKSIKSRIVDLAMGPNHTVCLTEDGKVITLGI